MAKLISLKRDKHLMDLFFLSLSALHSFNLPFPSVFLSLTPARNRVAHNELIFSRGAS